MDRISVAETVAVLAHDYGLYGFFDKLRTEWGFRGRRNLCFDTLEEDQKRLYHELEYRAEKTEAWDRKLARREP